MIRTSSIHTLTFHYASPTHRCKTTLLEFVSDVVCFCLQEVGERLHAIDINRHFTKSNFESQIKRWNGYQTHLVSPELAIRGIIGDAFADVAPIADWMMQSVRDFMSTAAKHACTEVVNDDPQKREALAAAILMVRHIVCCCCANGSGPRCRIMHVLRL